MCSFACNNEYMQKGKQIHSQFYSQAQLCKKQPACFAYKYTCILYCRPISDTHTHTYTHVSVHLITHFTGYLQQTNEQTEKQATNLQILSSSNSVSNKNNNNNNNNVTDYKVLNNYTSMMHYNVLNPCGGSVSAYLVVPQT
jgi:hypothetical protein